MSKAVDHLVEQLQGVRDSVSPGMLDSVKIECYGSTSELKHIAMVYSDGKRIQITPYDPALLGTINTALQKSGFSSYVFSKNSVVVSVPKRCGEEKEKIIKFVRALGEQAKISIRNIRHKARKELDDKEVQKMTDAANKEIVDLVEMKVDEING